MDSEPARMQQVRDGHRTLPRRRAHPRDRAEQHAYPGQLRRRIGVGDAPCQRSAGPDGLVPDVPRRLGEDRNRGADVVPPRQVPVPDQRAQAHPAGSGGLGSGGLVTGRPELDRAESGDPVQVNEAPGEAAALVQVRNEALAAGQQDIAVSQDADGLIQRAGAHVAERGRFHATPSVFSLSPARAPAGDGGHAIVSPTVRRPAASGVRGPFGRLRPVRSPSPRSAGFPMIMKNPQ
jgi:hypothetical protein